LTYQGEQFKKRVEPLAEELGAIVAGHCDVTDMESLDAVFDFVIATVGQAGLCRSRHRLSPDKDELAAAMWRRAATTSCMTMDISVYSFTAVAKRAEPLMTDGGSLLTLTYYGAEKVMPHYNVMGVAKAALEASVRYLAVDLGGKDIRVNAISAGPIKTLAASGIGDFRYILKWNEYNSPLKRNVRPRKSAIRASTSCPTSRAASPARCTTSMPAIMSSA
jgi:enoyl-[acyl-carrier protein] reductase I